MSLRANFTKSVLHYGNFPRPELGIEQPRQDGLQVLVGLGLNELKPAFEIPVQPSADMHLLGRPCLRLAQRCRRRRLRFSALLRGRRIVR